VLVSSSTSLLRAKEAARRARAWNSSSSLCVAHFLIHFGARRLIVCAVAAAASVAFYYLINRFAPRLMHFRVRRRTKSSAEQATAFPLNLVFADNPQPVFVVTKTSQSSALLGLLSLCDRSVIGNYQSWAKGSYGLAKIHSCRDAKSQLSVFFSAFN
jgi:hypothetical protein